MVAYAGHVVLGPTQFMLNLDSHATHSCVRPVCFASYVLLKGTAQYNSIINSIDGQALYVPLTSLVKTLQRND